MKKMFKGAALTGLGVALLLGGGGTLAVWNAEANSNAGTIVAGDLNVEADPGTWTSNLSGEIVDISTYRVIPGETLRYLQPLTVTLEGDELKAKLTVAGAGVRNGFLPENVEVSGPVLSNGAKILPGTVLNQDSPATVTATTTFQFLGDRTTGRQSVNGKYDFTGVGYELEQIAPGGN